jgi:hypothetical protein
VTGREPDRAPRRDASTRTQRDVSRTAGRSASRDPRSADDRLDAGATWSRQPELEELPPQRVVPLGSSRLGRTGVLAVAVMIGLLAAGFGLFGGRPSAIPGATPGAKSTPPAGSFSVILGPGASPVVTPWVECGPAPSGPPDVLLEFGDETILGTLESYFGPDGIAVPLPSSASDPSSAARVDVPNDAVSDLWIVGAACANQWTIELLGNDPSLFNTVGVLDSVTNLGLESAYAAQNRFELAFAPYGGDLTLSATLESRAFTVRVTWPIHVVPIDRPVGFLRAGNGTGASATEGCDVIMELGNGWVPQDGPCEASMPEKPIDWLTVAPGDSVEFALEGWDITGSQLACGHLDGLMFLVDEHAGCVPDPAGQPPVLFAAPTQKGDWILAINACAERPNVERTTTICGTWYADVAVSDR